MIFPFFPKVGICLFVPRMVPTLRGMNQVANVFSNFFAWFTTSENALFRLGIQIYMTPGNWMEFYGTFFEGWRSILSFENWSFSTSEVFSVHLFVGQAAKDVLSWAFLFVLEADIFHRWKWHELLQRQTSCEHKYLIRKDPGLFNIWNAWVPFVARFWHVLPGFDS